MDSLLQDLRYAIRMLVKKPVFAMVAILTLALGIGANTAIFTVVKAALLDSLPYREPQALVHLWETTPQKTFGQREASYPDFLDWRQAESFEGVAAYRRGGMMTLTGDGEPEAVRGFMVTVNFFEVLGVRPAAGRTFLPEDERPEAGDLAMLSHRMWQRRFGGDSSVIGRTLRFNDQPFTVVGVLPAGFHFAPSGEADLWAVYRPSQAARERRFMHGTNVIARLRPGASMEGARAEMGAIGARIAADHPDSHTGTQIKIVPLHEEFVGNLRPLLLALLGAVVLVLLIACANVANLQLARSAARQKEMAIRAALGAGRGRVIRQLLTESMVLAVLGGALGLGLARWGVDALIAAIPESQLNPMPFLRDLGIDWRVLGFTGLLSAMTGVVFGLAPALHASRQDLQETLKEGGKTSAMAVRQRLRGALVVGEMALALALLVGAGLLMQSVVRLMRVDPGFKAENLLTFNLFLPPARYADDKVMPAYQQLTARLEALPGVTGVGMVDILPMIGGNTLRLSVEGRPAPPPGQENEANTRTVSHNYFRVMGVELVAGRYFDERDDADAPPVVIVNRTLAGLLFGEEDATGRRLQFGAVGPQPFEIAGVVGDEKVNTLDGRTTPVVYFPAAQDNPRFTGLVVRGQSDVETMATAVRREIQSFDGALTPLDLKTMEQRIEESPSTFMRRYPAFLIGVFAGLAMLLAAIGIYGVISYSVSQRVHEIGIRMALGAGRRDILRLIIGQGMGLALAGVALGLAASFAVMRLLESLLFGVAATDPLTFALAAAVLVAVALLACYVPARRATRVDPMEALRYE